MTEGAQTKAWYHLGSVKGFDPGYLVLTPEGRLIFYGGEGKRIDAPLAGVTKVKFPRHWFDGGCKLTIGGEQHRVDFVRPNGAGDVAFELIDYANVAGPGAGLAADAAQFARKLGDIGSGRAAGKRWKEILTQ